MKKFIVVLISLIIVGQLFSQDMVNFNSSDGLQITADLYVTNPETSPFIILFHQAGWSRGEYIDIAPKLNALGFNCMAVDQRSGGGINDIENITHKEAKKAGKETRYIDALIDMQAVLNYVHTNYPEAKLLVWGSSYSAALVIKLASQNIGKVDGVLSFSPGEYFSNMGESETFIQDAAQNIDIPIFITSAKNEESVWKPIFEAIPSDKKTSFLPETKGNHGSRALWKKFDDSQQYWDAIENFLQTHFLE